MKPFFSRIGGKTPISKQIIEMIPEHDIYVEPFVGGGAVLFAKERSNVEVINDLDEQLMNGYNLLKRITENDVNNIIDTINNFEELDKNKRLESMNEFVNIEVSNNGLKLYQILLQMNNTYGSNGNGKIYNHYTRMRKINKIQEYKKRLNKVEIYSTDYKNIIDKYDSPTSFFFLDPPYEKSKNLYKNCTIDYNEMQEILSNIEGKFILTLNDSPNIRKIFENFNIIEINVRGISGHDNTIGGTYRNELIITNY